MDIRHLRYFVAVAQEGSFARAARRLYISGPPLSQRIKELEREIGAPLLVRGRRGVWPTAAGRVLLERASGIVDEVDALRTTVRLAAAPPNRDLGTAVER